MNDHVQSFNLGATTVTVINIGDVQEDLVRLLGATAEDQAAHLALFNQPGRLPIQSVHFAVPGASILVDAGAYDYPPDSPQLIPGYTPPLDLLGGLAQVGVDPNSITHVIITHAHGDHFNALTVAENGGYAPVFPNARHYLGRGDWEKMQPQLVEPDSLQSRTLGVIQARGQLELVDTNTAVAPGVTIIPAPGESPGHQVVRVSSEGETLYCIGDLYHATAEVAQPRWMPPWNDRAANTQSRATLNQRFVAEDARLIATHIHGVGKLRQTASGYEWVGIS